jgi:protein phosphatase
VVTRALGSQSGLLPDHWLLPAITGDRYLICSDGLFSELPDDAILPLLAAGDPQQAAETLVMAACDAGGHDNVTVVVVDIDADDDAGADETTLPRDQLPAAPDGSSARGGPDPGGYGSDGHGRRQLCARHADRGGGRALPCARRGDARFRGADLDLGSGRTGHAG